MDGTADSSEGSSVGKNALNTAAGNAIGRPVTPIPP